MARPSLYVVLLSVLVLLAVASEAARTPPGIANNPSHAVCKDPTYKECQNLVHVCPKFCPDSCYVHCQSCKPICGPEPPSPVTPPTPTTPPPVTPSPYPPTPTTPAPSPPPPTTPPTPTTPAPSPPPPTTPPPSPPTPTTPAPSPPTPTTPAPVTPSPSPPTPAPETPPTPTTPAPVTPSPPTPVTPPTPTAPAPETPPTPSPSPPTPAPETPPTPTTPAPETPPTPTTPSPSPPTPAPETPPTPTTPAPETPPTPTTPSPSPPTPSPETPPTPTTPSPETPPTPTTPSPSPPTPTTPAPETPPTPVTPTPSPSPPTPTTPAPYPPSSDGSAPGRRRRCHNRNYSQCYGVEHQCPSSCPNTCVVDCVTCKPVCTCDMPGAVCQDPRFIGGDGITFYFHGKKNQDFCLVTDPNLHINAHFIGKRNNDMKRDFTWVQSVGILFGNHQLFLGAQKTATWDNAVDRLALSFDGEPIVLPTTEGATWQSESLSSAVIKRDGDTNSLIIEVDGLFKISATVVPITKQESDVHNYGITDDDCFAHLELGFKFNSLSGKVNGVLGQTYQSGYVSRAKIGVAMPVLGGERQFKVSNLFATDCSVSQFERGSSQSVSVFDLELPSMKCGSGIGGRGVVCKR